MARALIPSDTTIRNVRPGDKRKRLSDGNGLYLLLFVKGGSHCWRLDYTVTAKRKTISLGTYPATGLKLAREKADAARQLVAAGVDPSTHRKGERAKHKQSGSGPHGDPCSFEAVAREWYDTRKANWSDSYGTRVIRRLEADVFPWLGKQRIDTIAPPQVLEVLRRIEGRGVIETAHRALESCSQVFRFGIAVGVLQSNPARDLKDALRTPVPKHFPAITDPTRLGEFLRASYDYPGTYVVRAALRLMPMLLLRPGELRHADWKELDLDSGVWTVPSSRMKREKHGKLHGKPHHVPLPAQAVEVLKELKELTGPTGYVFRGERDHNRPMSDATVNAAIRTMGFPADEVTGHGFRATARTLLAERLGIDAEIIEAQLAHTVRDQLGTAYNRTEFLDARRRMLILWADFLDAQRLGTREGQHAGVAANDPKQNEHGPNADKDLRVS